MNDGGQVALVGQDIGSEEQRHEQCCQGHGGECGVPLRYTGPWADRGRDIYRRGLLIPQPRSYFPLGAVPAGVAQQCQVTLL